MRDGLRCRVRRQRPSEGRLTVAVIEPTFHLTAGASMRVGNAEDS